MKHFPPIFLGVILASILGLNFIYEASQGHPMPFRAVILDPWQLGMLGIGWIIIALLFLRLGIKRMAKNGAPINNDVELKTTSKKKNNHKKRLTSR